MRKKKLYILYSKSMLVYMMILSMIVLFIVNSRECMEAARESLFMCAQTVIPSLFPFFVLSGLLIQTGFIRVAGALLSPLIRPLLRISGSGALAFVIGIVSGYPTGAKMAADLYRENLISRDEAKKLLPFCNNSGPLFIIGAVGSGMLGNVRIGIFLYLIHLAAALMVGVCFRFYGGNAEKSKIPVKTAVGSSLRMHYQSAKEASPVSVSVGDAVNHTLLICGFIVLFSAFTACLAPVLSLIKNESMRLMFNAFFEVTAGVKKICTSNLSVQQRLILISGVLGFGGICVHLQVLGMLAGTGLGLKTYLIGKGLHMIFAAVLCGGCIRFLSLDSVAAWSPGGATAPFSVGVWQMLLAFAVITIFFLRRLFIRKK